MHIYTAALSQCLKYDEQPIYGLHSQMKKNVYIYIYKISYSGYRKSQLCYTAIRKRWKKRYLIIRFSYGSQTMRREFVIIQKKRRNSENRIQSSKFGRYLNIFYFILTRFVGLWLFCLGFFSPLCVMNVNIIQLKLGFLVYKEVKNIIRKCMPLSHSTGCEMKLTNSKLWLKPIM